MSSEHLNEAADSLQKERFVQSLKQALIANKYSQRELCEALGITIGTLTKYLRGAVDPSKVGVAIMRNLAKELGFTTNTLLGYYETGEYHSSLTIDDVASWIRSEAGNSDLPALLAAASEASQRQPAEPVAPLNNRVEFTDADAELFTTAIRHALQDASASAGVSTRQVWSMVEEQLVKIGVKQEEINLMFELSFGIMDFTGEMMTKARASFIERFPTSCPLILSYRNIGKLADYSELDAAEKLCVAA